MDFGDGSKESADIKPNAFVDRFASRPPEVVERIRCILHRPRRGNALHCLIVIIIDEAMVKKSLTMFELNTTNIRL